MKVKLNFFIIIVIKMISDRKVTKKRLGVSFRKAFLKNHDVFNSCLFSKLFVTFAQNYQSMIRKFFSMALIAAVLCVFSACKEKHSAKYAEMEADIQTVEQQISENNDCDELQLVYFGILGLRSDLTLPEEEGGLAETEFEEISNKINDLEVMLKTKTQQLDCFNNDSINDVLDTMESEEFEDYNVL